MRAPLESAIVRQCLDYLALCRIPAWRNNTGAMRSEYKGKSRFVRFSVPGCSDILGILPPLGRLLAVECKRPGGKVSPAQQAFLGLVERAGGLAVVAYSLDDLASVMRDMGMAG